MTIDPVELERLSKAAEQEDDDVRYYGGPTSTHRPARDAYHAALVQHHRTGQLIPAQPSGDVVEAAWETLKARCCADPANAKRCVMVSKDDFTAAITTYEAVSGVAKMREALDYYAKDYDYERGCSQWDGGASARAALGEKP